MSVAAADRALLKDLLGDEEVDELFAAEAEVADYLAFEIALAEAEAAEGLIPMAAAKAVASAGLEPDLAAMRAAAARDGVATVEFVRQLRAAVGSEHEAHVHFGATSQDLIDTSLVMRLASLAELFDQRLEALIAELEGLSARYGTHKLIGRTRMQDALPIPVGARVEAWSLPLARHRERLNELRPRLLVLQFGGAVGTLDKLGNKGRAVAARMAETLGLGLPVRSWHSQRDNIAEFAGWLSLVTGSLGKMGEDIALMAQNAVGEIEIEGGGGSSAMPHKQNPVKAEVLVALARYNAALLVAMHGALVHEQERSGAAWALEWLALPQMAVATGAALRNATTLAGSIRGMGVRHG